MFVLTQVFHVGGGGLRQENVVTLSEIMPQRVETKMAGGD